jgi:hypothetical protein
MKEKDDDLPTPNETDDGPVQISVTCSEQEYDAAFSDFLAIFSKEFPKLYHRLFPGGDPKMMAPERCCGLLVMLVMNYLKFQTSDLPEEVSDDALKLFTTAWMQTLSHMPGGGVEGVTILQSDIEEHPELIGKIAQLVKDVDPDKTIH